MRKLLAAISFLSLLCLHSNGQGSRLTTYGPYTIPLRGLEKTKFYFITDRDTLLPNFASLSNDTVVAARALYDAGAMSPVFKRVLNETGWHSPIPYAVGALYDALGRIMFSLSLDMVIPDRPTLGSETIRICLFANAQLYRAASAKAGHTRADAYYLRNAEFSEVGLFLDPQLVSWALHLRSVQRDDKIQDVRNFNHYFRRLFMKFIGHEMFHIMQSKSSSDFYLLPAFTEGAATFVQENIYEREESVILTTSESMYKRGSFSGAIPNAHYCIGIWARTYRAFAHVLADSSFSLSHLIGLSPASFDKGTREEVEMRYDIAYTMMRFLRYQETFDLAKSVAQDFIENKNISKSFAQAQRLDTLFRLYCKICSEHSWLDPKADSLFFVSASGCTICLAAVELLPSYNHACNMHYYKPDDPTGPLYVGDIFYRTNNPFLGLFYYKTAKAKDIHNTMKLRIDSRLAEAYEQVGDIDQAMLAFSGIQELVPKSYEAITYYRCILKYEFYKRFKGTDYWGAPEGRRKVNAYVVQFQKPFEENPSLYQPENLRQAFLKVLNAITSENPN